MIQKFRENLIAGIQTAPILFIPHYHFSYIDEVLESILSTNEKKRFNLDLDSILEFDLAHGPINFKTKKELSDSFSEGALGFLKEILQPRPAPKDETIKDRRNIKDHHQLFLFKSIHGELKDSKSQSLLQTFVEKYEKGEVDPLRTIIIVSNCFVSELPKEVARLFTIVHIPTPDSEDIEMELGISDHQIPDNLYSRKGIYEAKGYKFGNSFYNKDGVFKKNRKQLISALLGMQLYDIRKVLSTIQKIAGEINPYYENSHCSLAEHILREKRQLVNNSSLLEVIDLQPDQKERIGNIDNLRIFINKQSQVIDNISNYPQNLPRPKGVLLVGPPGCGKSETVKSIAAIFDKTLLRLDLGKLMGRFVGESEHNLIEAIRTAEAAQPCVLWIDEIEKAFAGFGNNDQGNDITITRMVGYFLTWMQERKSLVYLVATANDLSSLRPELLRKGRWDEIFYLSYPDSKGACEIFQKCLKKYGLYLIDGKEEITTLSGNVKVEYKMKNLGGKLAKSNFSGAEIDSLIVQSFNEDWNLSDSKSVSYKTVLNLVDKIANGKIKSEEDSLKKKIDEVILDYKIASGQDNLPKESEIRKLLKTKYERISSEQLTSEYKSKGYMSAS